MEKKRVFIACPIGEKDSDIRIHADKVRQFLIEPVVKEIQPNGILEIKRADDIGMPGRITTQILKELQDADVVIADLTGLNSNVLYELGIRQGRIKPYILIAQNGTNLPFDLQDHRTVFFELSLESIEVAKKELLMHLDAALKGHVEPFDSLIFEGSNKESKHDSIWSNAILPTLGDIVSTNKDMKVLINALDKKLVEQVIKKIPNSSHSGGSYVFIEGEEPAFAELIAATLRAKGHVRSTRFSLPPIIGNKEDYAQDYADAIAKRVNGHGDNIPITRYSRIITANNLDKLKEVEYYVRSFYGKAFTLYLTPDFNNFELVIIDNSEVFIHFHGRNIIDSTVHIFGDEVTNKFVQIFDEFHNPKTHPKVRKYDCKYILEENVEKILSEITAFFKIHVAQ